jgi:hypothetical protein
MRKQRRVVQMCGNSAYNESERIGSHYGSPCREARDKRRAGIHAVRRRRGSVVGTGALAASRADRELRQMNRPWRRLRTDIWSRGATGRYRGE